MNYLLERRESSDESFSILFIFARFAPAKKNALEPVHGSQTTQEQAQA